MWGSGLGFGLCLWVGFMLSSPCRYLVGSMVASYVFSSYKATTFCCWFSYLRYRDDEDDIDGSGEEEHLYRENDGGGYNTHRLHEESINVVRMQFLGSFCVKNISPGLRRGDWPEWDWHWVPRRADSEPTSSSATGDSKQSGPSKGSADTNRGAAQAAAGWGDQLFCTTRHPCRWLWSPTIRLCQYVNWSQKII